MVREQSDAAAAGLLDFVEVPVGLGPSGNIDEAGHIGGYRHWIVVVVTGVHGEELPVVVFETEVAGLLADVVDEPVITVAAGVHVVVAAETVEGNAAAENLTADGEEVVVGFALRAGVVDVAEVKEDVGFEGGDPVEEVDGDVVACSPVANDRDCGLLRETLDDVQVGTIG
jgi:hypothetical protein